MKTIYLENIVRDTAMDIFDWIREIWHVHNLLHLRLKGKKFKLYLSEDKLQEIDMCDSNFYSDYYRPSLDLFLFTRKITLLHTKNKERLIIY